MNPNQAPPAPPPMQPVPPNQNPYDFITEAGGSQKRSFVPGGGSKKVRILIVAVGFLLLAILAAIVIGVIGGGAKGPKDDYQSLVEQQAELIRLSAIGVQKAQVAEAKNLAITTNYSLTSEQAALLTLAKKTGALTDASHLAAGKNDKTDALFTTASQTNQFDEVFAQTIQGDLKTYQAILKKLYDETTVDKTRTVLGQDYMNASALSSFPSPPAS